MNFGQAIEALKAGQRVSRAGWNGKGMWLVLGTPLALTTAPLNLRLQTDVVTTIDPCIVMFTAQRSLQPGWLASQADMLAEDWEVVE